MRLLKATTQGILSVDGVDIVVYQLEDGQLAAGQAAIYRFLTAGSTSTISRHQLGVSNLGKYLPKKMLSDSELAMDAAVRPIRLFTAAEWLNLCKAVIMADFDGKIKQKWSAAPRRAQLLLLLFAESGITQTMKKVLKKELVQIDDCFEKYLIRLLRYPSFP